MRKPKQQTKPLNDLSRSLTPFDPNQTLTAVVELSKKTWLVAGIIPGVERQPLKKVAADANELLKLLERWRIVPRFLNDVSERDTSVELFGRRVYARVRLSDSDLSGRCGSQRRRRSVRPG